MRVSAMEHYSTTRSALCVIAIQLLLILSAASAPTEELQVYQEVFAEITNIAEACEVATELLETDHFAKDNFLCNHKLGKINWKSWVLRSRSIKNTKDVQALIDSLDTPVSKRGSTMRDGMQGLKNVQDSAFNWFFNTILGTPELTSEEDLSENADDTKPGYAARFSSVIREKGRAIHCKLADSTDCKIFNSFFLSELETHSLYAAKYVAEHPEYEGLAKFLLDLWKLIKPRQNLVDTLSTGTKWFTRLAHSLGMTPTLLLIMLGVIAYLFGPEYGTSALAFVFSVGVFGFPILAIVFNIIRSVARADRTTWAAFTMSFGSAGAITAYHLSTLSYQQTAVIVLSTILVAYIITTIHIAPNWHNIVVSAGALLFMYWISTNLDAAHVVVAGAKDAMKINIPDRNSIKDLFLQIKDAVRPQESKQESNTYLRGLAHVLHGNYTSIYTVLSSACVISTIIVSVYISNIGDRIYTEARNFFVVKDHQDRAFNMPTYIKHAFFGAIDVPVIASVAAAGLPCLLAGGSLTGAVLAVSLAWLMAVFIFYGAIANSIYDLGKDAAHQTTRVIGSDGSSLAGRRMPSDLKHMYNLIKTVLLMGSLIFGALPWLQDSSQVFVTTTIVILIFYFKKLSDEDTLLVVLTISIATWGTLGHLATAALMYYIFKRGWVRFKLDNLDLSDNVSRLIDHPA